MGRDLGHELVAYKRRIGPWLLWRAGPAAKGNARYLALAADDPTTQFSFRLHPSGDGKGLGPDGVVHHRFRAWKEALRDAARRSDAFRARVARIPWRLMERQAGLGRSLEDVLDSLTPVGPADLRTPTRALRHRGH